MEFQFNPGNISGKHKAVPLKEDITYDVLIIGGGPAALTAAVYCMRKGITTGLITKNIGGQVADTAEVENYLGYLHITGTELVQKFQEQVKQFEIGISEGERAEKIKDGDPKKVVLANGKIYSGKSVIITTGKRWRRLGVPGEEELIGKGVAFCSICDAPLFAGKKVMVVGGGNSGIESVIDLAKIAERVTLVQFLDTLTADDSLIKVMKSFTNVDILLEHEVVRINGSDRVDSVVVRDRKTMEEQEHAVQGIFIEIGLDPNSEIAEGLLELNKYKEIAINCSCETSVPGIFAAGDVTSVPFKQIIIAAGEGSKAALAAYDYILKK